MSDDSYNPRSPDAMFSRILERLDQQDRKKEDTDAKFLLVLNRIEGEAKKTNGRVTALERWKDVVTAKVALIATVVSGSVGVAGWLISLYRG